MGGPPMARVLASIDTVDSAIALAGMTRSGFAGANASFGVPPKRDEYIAHGWVAHATVCPPTASPYNPPPHVSTRAEPAHGEPTAVGRGVLRDALVLPI